MGCYLASVVKGWPMTCLGPDASGSVSRLEWRKSMLDRLLESRHTWIQGFVSGKLFESHNPLTEEPVLQAVEVNGQKKSELTPSL